MEQQAASMWRLGEVRVQTTIALNSITWTSVVDELGRSIIPGIPEELEGLEERYEPIELLGDGGMGQVWRVHDKTLGREVALKVMHRRRAHCDKQVARFVEEAQVTSQLKHSGVVTVYDLGSLPDGRFYFSMDAIDGDTLTQLIRAVHTSSRGGQWRIASDNRNGPGWSLRWLVDVFLQVCEVVAHAHTRGVIHRDLKPQNIMVGPYGDARLLDWGLARVEGRAEIRCEAPIRTERSESGEHATLHGAVIGTPAYMSPEQARGEPLDNRSDIYSLGCVLYEILAGEAPYKFADITTLLTAMKNGDVEPLPEHLPLPPGLVAICEAAMAHDAADRYPTADALAAAVADWLLNTH